MLSYGADLPTDETVLVSHADEVPEEVWRETAEHLSVYAARSWARLACESGRYDCSYIQAVDRLSGNILGILPLYAPLGYVNSHYGPTALLGSLGSELDDQQRRWVYVGTHGGYLTQLPLVPHLTRRERTDVLLQLFAAANSMRAAQGASALCMAYAPRRDAVEAANAMGGATSVVFTGGDCNLRVSFATFEEYLAQLGSHRRGIVARDLRRFEASGLRIAVAGLSDITDDIAPLVAELEQKYGNPMAEHEALAFVRRHADAFADQSVAFLAMEGERVVGCAVFYMHATRLYARFCGFDYGRTDGSCAYPMLLFHAPLRYAIEHGFEELHLGIGSYAAKLLRGCALRELWSVIGWDTLDESLRSELTTQSQVNRRQFLDSWKPLERASSRAQIVSSLD